jgi:hypothetical protein
MTETKRPHLIERVTEDRRHKIITAATILATLASLSWVYGELKKASSDKDTPQLKEAQSAVDKREQAALSDLSTDEQREAHRLANLQIGASEEHAGIEGGQNE